MGINLDNSIDVGTHRKKPTIICLTPVKNEAQILDRFLACTSLWADHIIIADQSSNDGSRDIALKYPKVRIIDNPSPDLNQGNHQLLLINSAREISGPRILITLDADEILTSNFMRSPEWITILNSDPGTLFELKLLNLLPDMKSYWNSEKDIYYPFIFFDNDGEYKIGKNIHCGRLPENACSHRVRLANIQILHYAYTNLNRVASKQRWYQCWEVINRPSRRVRWLYRYYHGINSVPENEIFSLKDEFIQGYEQKGIDMTSISQDLEYWRERQILDWMSQYGAKKFRKIPIWDVNWSLLANQFGISNSQDFQDPRGYLEKAIHYWFKKTQSMKDFFLIRIIDKLLILIGW